MIVGVLLAISVGVCLLWWHRRQQPKREALSAVAALQQGLSSVDPSAVLQNIMLPASLHGRTEPEQMEFLTKTLHDELSVEGLAVLRRQAAFGPLKEIFPAEAEQWARAAGVEVQNCVAFRAEKNGLRAEVVLARTSDGYRVVRCNNVKQLAM